jgi:hypothetical protein
MENDCCQGTRQEIDTWYSQTGHFDNATQCVAFSTSLYSKEAYGVGLIEIQCDLPT